MRKVKRWKLYRESEPAIDNVIRKADTDLFKKVTANLNLQLPRKTNLSDLKFHN